jgi:hypothetical protein
MYAPVVTLDASMLLRHTAKLSVEGRRRSSWMRYSTKRLLRLRPARFLLAR